MADDPLILESAAPYWNKQLGALTLTIVRERGADRHIESEPFFHLIVVTS
jgi:hypothetical protein